MIKSEWRVIETPDVGRIGGLPVKKLEVRELVTDGEISYVSVNLGEDEIKYLLDDLDIRRYCLKDKEIPFCVQAMKDAFERIIIECKRNIEALDKPIIKAEDISALHNKVA